MLNCDPGSTCFRVIRREYLELFNMPQYDEQQDMHKLAVTVLCELIPHLRLCQIVMHIIEQNISQNPQWNILVASEIMKHFEKYAWNLIDYPWKKEFLTIKVIVLFFLLPLLFISRICTCMICCLLQLSKHRNDFLQAVLKLQQ